ncbi:hypothetical protein Jasper_3 [Mycobacterium phage Jasper]|uniref:Uncharacterized protein n=3 Tax=Fromanvirus TaxID=186764 RepID=B3VGP1_9CAUD|nr:hypothetical protein Jasper_3 [Mycobacterium phage Jasper]YP_009013992.1 hypothetical protein CL62_gp03 [Mycobacterium phage Dreamboat]YP_009019078.1 hypothetical protein CL86_gp003 [Mycobacterium phage SkiPole]YP_009021571.1 hypothetical protein PBI_ALSFRO_3 [Mycobacterium phage Alsfro]YP_009189874.1 hypothetical protein SEA_PEPE_3 [Mycobacterium phage Pepe]AXQ61844.1 hypothetical protein SEA_PHERRISBUELLER_3 [Mycobacterium phage PherrisBueller]QOP65866.1 hypothetical protein SEA_STLSCUM_
MTVEDLIFELTSIPADLEVLVNYGSGLRGPGVALLQVDGRQIVVL